MSYNTIALMAGDYDLRQRFIACAAQEGETSPDNWVQVNVWQLCSASDLVASYEYAHANRVRNPGSWDDVINDQAILGVVQARRAALAA